LKTLSPSSSTDLGDLMKMVDYEIIET